MVRELVLLVLFVSWGRIVGSSLSPKNLAHSDNNGITFLESELFRSASCPPGFFSGGQQDVSDELSVFSCSPPSPTPKQAEMPRSVALPVEVGLSKDAIDQLVRLEGDALRIQFTSLIANSMTGARFFNLPGIVENQELCAAIVRQGLGQDEQVRDVYDVLQKLASEEQAETSCWSFRRCRSTPKPRHSISQSGRSALFRSTTPPLAGYQRDEIEIRLAQLHPTPQFPAQVTQKVVEEYLKESMEKLGKDIRAELLSAGRACAILEFLKLQEDPNTCRAILSKGLGTERYAALVLLAGATKEASTPPPSSSKPADSEFTSFV